MKTDKPSTTEAEQRFEYYSGMPAPDVYFRQISEYELLTHEEEASLGKLVQAGMGAEEARSAELDKEHPDIDRLHKLEYIQQLGAWQPNTW